MIRIRIAVLTGFAVCFFAVQTGWAKVPRVIPAGQTVCTAGQGNIPGEINRNGTETTGPYANTEPIVDMREGSTLYVTNGPGSGTSIWAGLVVTNGTATVLMSNNSTPTFSRGVIIRGTGKLVIKSNACAAKFGAFNYRHFYELGNLEFQKADGTVKVGTASFSCARIVELPSETKATISGCSGTNYLCGVSDMFAGNDRVNMAKFADVRVQTAESALSHSTLVIASGARMGFEPMAPFDMSIQNYVDTWASGIYPTATNEMNFVGGIEIKAGGSLVNELKVATTLRLNGPITGSGAFLHDSTGGNGAANCSHLVLKKVDDYEGTVELSYSGAGTLNQPYNVIDADMGSLSNVNITIGARCGVMGAENLKQPYVGHVVGASGLSYAYAHSGQQLNLGYVSGTISCAGEGVTVSTNNILGIASAAVLGDSGTSTILYNGGSPYTSGCVTATSFTGDFTAIAMPGPDGTTDIGALDRAMADYPYLKMDVGDGAVMSHAPDHVVLNGDSNVTATVIADGGVDISIMGSATFKLYDSTAQAGSFTNAVNYWFDPSYLASVKLISQLSDEPDESYINTTWAVDGHSYRVFEAVEDWRYPGRAGRLWNDFYESYPGSTRGSSKLVCPVLISNGYDDKSYIRIPHYTGSPSGNRRLPFTFTPNSGYGQPLPSEEIIMVFGSQKGGGVSLVATDTSDLVFLRKNGTANPFLSDATNPHGITLRVGGYDVDPTVARPNGGWQLLSIGMQGLPFKGLGFVVNRMDGTDYGANDQNYGEIMIFTNKIDAATRIEAELYLAKKWHLSYPTEEMEARLAEIRRNAVTNRVNLSGTGTLVGAGRTLELDGVFTGRVELNGDQLAITKRVLPFAESEIPSENREFWLDADATNSLAMLLDYNPQAGYPSNVVRAAGDKVSGFVSGKPFLLGVGVRMPYLVEEARGFGPQRHWLDFHEYTSETKGGNNLRFVDYVKDYNFAQGAETTRSTFGIRTAFFIQDFSRGGRGNSLLRNVSGDGKIGIRSKRTDPIWPGSTTEFTGGENRLNGIVVDQTQGVTGKPELLSLRATGAVSSNWFIDYYGNTEATSINEGARYGEVLLYSGTLTDEQITGIEGYLMQKWLGTLPPGIVDLTGATLGGNGYVTVARDDLMPNLATDFSGKLTLGGDSAVFNVVINPKTGVITGALNAEDAEFKLPPNCTLNVDFSDVLEGSVSERRYTLVNCKAYVDGVNWTKNMGGNVPPMWASWAEDGNKIELVIQPAGFMIMVK